MELIDLNAIEVETQSLNEYEIEPMALIDEEFLPLEEEYDGNDFLNKVKEACI